MPQVLTFLQGKPSDIQIRIIRILWAIILILLFVFGWDDFMLAYGLPMEAKYALGIFPMISLIRGILDPWIFHRKTWRWIMVGSAIVMILVSWFLIVPEVSDVQGNTITSSTGAVSATDLLREPTVEKRSPLSVSFYLAFMGFLLLFTGLTLANKNITRKNEKYKDVIKTIRV